jgi:hypothetical protein
MNIAAALTLQTVPFAGIVLAGREDRDLFAVVYLGEDGVFPQRLVEPCRTEG